MVGFDALTVLLGQWMLSAFLPISGDYASADPLATFVVAITGSIVAQLIALPFHHQANLQSVHWAPRRFLLLPTSSALGALMWQVSLAPSG